MADNVLQFGAIFTLSTEPAYMFYQVRHKVAKRTRFPLTPACVSRSRS